MALYRFPDRVKQIAAVDVFDYEAEALGKLEKLEKLDDIAVVTSAWQNLTKLKLIRETHSRNGVLQKVIELKLAPKNLFNHLKRSGLKFKRQLCHGIYLINYIF